MTEHLIVMIHANDNQVMQERMELIAFMRDNPQYETGLSRRCWNMPLKNITNFLWFCKFEKQCMDMEVHNRRLEIRSVE